MKELIKQNYEVTCQRGLITDETQNIEFIDKIFEEVKELITINWSSDGYNEKCPENYKQNFRNELSDVILVCMNFATHLNIDIEQALKEKIEINRKRI